MREKYKTKNIAEHKMLTRGIRTKKEATKEEWLLQHVKKKLKKSHTLRENIYCKMKTDV